MEASIEGQEATVALIAVVSHVRRGSFVQQSVL